MDLLELVQTRFLRVIPDERANCREAVNELERLHLLCMEESGYCAVVSGDDSVRSKPDLSTLYDSDAAQPSDTEGNPSRSSGQQTRFSRHS